MKSTYKHGSNRITEPYEPKQTNRFIVIFPTEFDIAPQVIFKVSPIVMLATNMQVEPIVFYMYDPVSPSTSLAINEGLRQLRTKDDKTIKIVIHSLDPIGNVVEEWILDGEIVLVDFGELNWNVDMQRIIKLEFDVHTAIYNY